MKITLATSIALAVCMFAATACWGFPGPPMSLHKGWADSSCVVLADVTSTGEFEIGDHPPGQTAVLAVREVLKGPEKQELDPIHVFTFYGSPGPFHFEQGQRLLLFLRFDDEVKMYTPIAFEACIKADDRVYQQYSTVLKKLPAIFKVPDPMARQRQLVEWSVECALHPITRENGVIGLWYLRGKRKGTPEDPITADHIEKLVKAITSETPPHKDASDIAYFLEPYANPALDRYLLESLRRSHEPGWRDLTRTAVEQLPGRLGIELKQSTQERLDEWGDLLSVVFYNIDRRKEPKRFENEKERFNILWGALSREIFDQCKDAVENKK